jgi:hypothetical protein
MWYRLFHGLGKLARTVRWPAALLRRGRRQKAPAEDTRETQPGDSLPAAPPDFTDDRLLEAALALAAETARAILQLPSVRAALEGAVLKAIGATREQSQPDQAVLRNAEAIAAILRERGVVAKRIGLDGLPGSGKSSLARALADQLGFQWRSLDQENVDVPRDFTQEHTVYDHHRLFRTQDVDVFDAIVYVDDPVHIARTRVMPRTTAEKSENLISAVLDYDRLKKVGDSAFNLCDGAPLRIPHSRLLMKIRPPGGFRALENIVMRLQAVGIDAEGLGKEEVLFLCVYGKPRSGLMAYFRPGAFDEQLLRGLLTGLRRYLVR